MEKSYAVIVLFVSALCFSSALARKTPDAAKLFVVGKIFCDPCNFKVETRLSTPLAGYNVSLACYKEGTGKLTYSKGGVSDEFGQYSIPVYGDHEEESCEVSVQKPTEGQCIEQIPNNAFHVYFGKNMTATSTWSHFVNPFGFMTEKVDPECAMVSNEMDPFMNS